MDQSQRSQLERRLKRWELWVSLWLTRLLGFMPHVCISRDGIWREVFDWALTGLAKTVMCIVLCQASLRVKLPARRGFRDPRMRDDCCMRAMYGAALRRAFKAKTLQERLAKIRTALEQSEILIARFAHRLRRGMTKIMSAHTRVAIVTGAGILDAVACAALFGSGAASPCADFDTS